MTRQALLVLGMHRSGTSALTGLLIRLGAQGPQALMPPNESNPLGYWESSAFAAFNERLLASNGSRWDAWTRVGPTWFDSAAAVEFASELRTLLEQEFGDVPLFVIKDPRICRFVPFWLRVLRVENIAPAAIIPVRSPLEVACSLEARDGLTRQHSLLMWLRHVLDAEFETRNITRSLVRYRDLLKDWRVAAGTISADIGVDWPGRSGAADAEIAEFLSPELRHHAIGIEALDVAIPFSDWLRQSCEALDLLLEPHAPRATEAFGALDEVRRELDRAASVFGPAFEGERTNLEAERNTLRTRVSSLELERNALQEQTSKLTGELAGTRQHVEALLGSASWRMTAPLRAAMRVLMRGA